MKKSDTRILAVSGRISNDISFLLPHPCKRCNGRRGIAKIGKPPHKGALHCAKCDRWQKWLSKQQAQELLQGGEQ